MSQDQGSRYLNDLGSICAHSLLHGAIGFFSRKQSVYDVRFLVTTEVEMEAGERG